MQSLLKMFKKRQSHMMTSVDFFFFWRRVRGGGGRIEPAYFEDKVSLEMTEQK